MTTTLAIRADASPDIGGGHVMRCLTLAEEMARRGAEVHFFSISGTAEIVPALARSGFAIESVAADASSWPAAIKAWRPGGVDLVVIDSYAAGADQESMLRQVAGRILVIDDLPNRTHDCDLLIDQNLGRRNADYTSLVPAGCVIMTGPQFALLRPAFAAARNRALEKRVAGGPVKRILISMGMTDVGGITARVANVALKAAAGAQIDVVIGSGAPSLEHLRECAASAENVHLHIDSADMCELMVAADIAIGAAGSTSWERCCLGLPTITVVLADNQIPGGLALQDAGAAALIDGPDLVEGLLPTALSRLLAPCDDVRRKMAYNAFKLVDGCGAKRITARICAIEIRRANRADSMAIWQWRNDAETRRQSRHNKEIAFAEHSAWYEKALNDPSRLLLVAEVDGQAGAIVRFDEIETDESCGNVIKRVLVSINIAPQQRGRRIGELILAEACELVERERSPLEIIAEIAEGNPASAKVFAACGFEQIRAADSSGFMTFARVAGTGGTENTMRKVGTHG